MVIKFKHKQSPGGKSEAFIRVRCTMPPLKINNIAEKIDRASVSPVLRVHFNIRRKL